jgi:hypothetical protein
MTLEEALKQAHIAAPLAQDGKAYLIYNVNVCTWTMEVGNPISDEPVLYVDNRFPGEVFPYWDDTPHSVVYDDSCKVSKWDVKTGTYKREV